MAKTVRAPDGRTWSVGRRWAGHRVRWRASLARRMKRAGTTPGRGRWIDFIPDELAPVVFVLVLVAVFVLVVVFPAFALLVDLLLIAVTVAAGVAARVLFRRPWTVTATTDGDERTWQVVGWRASGKAVDDVADHLEAGVEPTPAPSHR